MPQAQTLETREAFFRDFNSRYQDKWSAEWSELTGRIRVLSGFHTDASDLPAEDAAWAFLKAYQDMLGVGVTSLRVENVEAVGSRTSVIFRQFYDGLPVYSSEVIVLLSEAREVLMYKATYFPVENVSTAATIQASQALDLARRRAESNGVTTLQPAYPTLVVFPHRTFTGLTYRPAWLFVLSAENSDYTTRFIVDAGSSEILEEKSLVRRDNDGRQNGGRAPPTLLETSLADPRDSSSGPPPTVTARAPLQRDIYEVRIEPPDGRAAAGQELLATLRSSGLENLATSLVGSGDPVVEVSAEELAVLAQSGLEFTILRRAKLIEQRITSDTRPKEVSLRTSYRYGEKGTDVWIPDNNPNWTAYSRISITGAPLGSTVTEVDVHFEVIHTYVGDLEMSLDNNARSVWMWQRQGGSTHNINQTYYGITNYLGDAVNQDWYLWARDRAAADVGYIDYWWIKVYYQEPAKPNLTFYTPPGWDYPIVASQSPGGNRVTALYGGQPTYIDWAIQNNGAASATTTFYTDLLIDGSFVERWQTIGGLTNGYVTKVEDYARTLSVGTHTLTIVIDSTGVINESTESDNSYSIQFTWLSPVTPTLTGAKQYRGDTNAEVMTGSSIPFGVSVIFKASVASGNGDAVRLEVELRQVTEAFVGVPTSETISTYVSSGAIASTPARQGLVPATYKWQARVVDVAGRASGWIAAANPAFTVLPAPNLVITSVSFSPASATAGLSAIDVTFTVRNDGGAPAGLFSNEVFLSANSFISGLDTLLGTASVGSLGIGESKTVTTSSVSIPAGITSGSYYVGVYADRLNAVPESDDSNASNTRVSSSLLEVLDDPWLKPDSGDGDPLGDRIPLILIHGIWTDAGRWDHFVSNLQAQLHGTYKIYRFQYQTSRWVPPPSHLPTIHAVGKTLAQRIAQFRARSDGQGFGNKKLVLVAHSQGGLVARSYMEQQLDTTDTATVRAGENVLGLFTLGTPHHGITLISELVTPTYEEDMKWDEYNDTTPEFGVNRWLRCINAVAPVQYACNGSETRLTPIATGGFYFDRLWTYAAMGDLAVTLESSEFRGRSIHSDRRFSNPDWFGTCGHTDLRDDPSKCLWNTDGRSSLLNVLSRDLLSMLTVFPTPVNGRITAAGVSSGGINCGNGGNGDCGELYGLETTAVTLTAVPSNGYYVGAWTECDSSNGNQCTVQMNRARTVSVSFAQTAFPLTISPVPVNGVVTGAGISCGTGGTGDCSESYAGGASVTLTATPATGWVLSTWTGACGGTGSCVVTMTSALSVSATFQPVPAPAAPSHLIAAAISQSQINLTWQRNSTDETEFHVERSTNATTGWAELGAVPAGSTGSSHAGLTCGTTYYFRVRAHRHGDGQYSDYSNVASAPTQTCAGPAAPTNLSAVAASQSQVNLTWQRNSTDESEFHVEQSPNGVSGWTEVLTAGSGATSTSRTSLTCGTTYYFRVRAHRHGDSAYSDYSNVAGTTTFACSVGAPSNLTATALSQSQVNLVWQRNSTDETEFHIEQSVTATGGWTEVATATGGSSSFLRTGLTCGTTYFFQVRAHRHGDGQFSVYSNVASVSTPSCPTPSPVTGIVTLATALTNPVTMALDDSSVYWTEDGSGTLKKVSKSGGTVTTLISGLNFPRGLAVDSAYVYFEEYGSATGIRKVPKNGGPPVSIASAQPSAVRLALDGGVLYWTDYAGGTIRSASTSGGSVSTLATGSNSPFGIAVRGGTVYWSEFTNPGAIRKVSVSGGAVTTLAAGSNTPGIATDAANLYWTESVFVNGGKVYKLPLSGGTPVALATGLNSPWDVAADGTSVFWVENGTSGSVKQVASGGGAPIVLADGLPEPVAIAVDDSFVYWLERNGGAVGSGTLKTVSKQAAPVDNAAPDTFITTGPSGTLIDSSATFGWGGVDNITSSDQLQFSYRLDPLEPNYSAFSTVKTKSYSSLANGTYTFYVKARDQASNEDPTPSARTFTVNAVTGGTDPLIDQEWHLKSRTFEPAGSDVIPAWPLTRGLGVVIGIVDDGLQYTHPDLQSNYLAALSRDFNDNDPDPSPTSADAHGTAVAGVAAARGENAVGVSGVAPLASLAGLRLIAAPTTDAQQAAALSHEANGIHISNNSWGPADDGRTLGGPGALTQAAIENATAVGRSGRGRIFVWASGNGRANNDNCNFDGFANNRFAIAVGALDDTGQQAWYSESCSALFVSAPSNGGVRGITTTDLVGASGYDGGDYTSSFGGTSSATPLVSGITALMLARNPSLGWRDVQHILARTAVRVNPSDPGWSLGPWPHNEKYGFGLGDAAAAVSLATGWTNVAPEAAVPSVTRTVELPIPDNNSTGVTDTAVIPPAYGTFEVEHVEVQFSASHSWRGDLEVTLTSPSGTVSKLATVRPADSGHDFSAWRFRSVRHWGETAAGTWTLRVADRQTGDVGLWHTWTLRVFGREGATRTEPPPEPPAPAPSPGGGGGPSPSPGPQPPEPPAPAPSPGGGGGPSPSPGPQPPEPPSPPPTPESPGSPSNLAGFVDGSSVTLTWNPPVSGEPPSAYILDVGSSPGSSDLLVYPTGNPGTSFFASGVQSGLYYVRVRSAGRRGAGGSSNEIALVVGTGPGRPPDPQPAPGVPGAPRQLTSAVNGSSLTLTWQPPSSGSAPTGYLLEAGSSPGARDIAVVPVGPGLSFSANGVANGTYYLRLKALSGAGTSPASNEIAVVIGGGPTPPTPPTPGPCGGTPSAPSGLTFGVDGSTVTLRWTASSGVPTSYLLEAGSSSGAANLAQSDTGGTSTVLVARDVPPSTYFVRVRARNACGVSSPSNEVIIPVR